jgi:hypothetical protein
MIQPKVLNIDCPKLVDLALLDVQTHLTKKLSWLDYAFGRAERQHDKDGNTYPGLYQGNNEYLNLLPDTNIGNYSYFEIDDGQEIYFAQSTDTAKNHRFTAEFGLVFFFDFRDVYPGEMDYKTAENVKYSVIEAITTARLNTCSIELTNIYEQAPNVYRGFDHEEIKREFTKRPYGIFKITGQVNVLARMLKV